MYYHAILTLMAFMVDSEKFFSLYKNCLFHVFLWFHVLVDFCNYERLISISVTLRRAVELMKIHDNV